MPDREKIIKDLEECLSASCRGFRPRLSCPYNDEEWDIMRDVLTLMKEQEPVEVIHHEAPYGYPFNTGKCPVCFQQLDEGDKFCRECGQAVKWE